MAKPNLRKVIHEAKRRGLFVLAIGDGDNFKYEFSCVKTGKWVLSFYPHRQFWTGVGDAKGSAKTYLEALSHLPARRSAG